MKLSKFFLRVFLFLIYPATITTTILYLYPIFLGCNFPAPEQADLPRECIFEQKTPNDVTTNVTKYSEIAPFRLLAFGDPQLEGDSSLPNHEDPLFPSVRRFLDPSSTLTYVGQAREAGIGLITKDIPSLLNSYRKRLDLLGNDFYLAHVYRTMHWWVQPTHVTVLGDLLGSQWISDQEFERRGWRFWNRVFRNGKRVDDDTSSPGRTEVLGRDASWSHRIINVAGNHDIGYAGDVNRARIDRFERTFGKVNWDIRFQLPSKSKEGMLSPLDFGGPPEIRIVILNSMNLDGPTLDPEIQQETYNFINEQIIRSQRPVEDKRAATIVLTHIPLYKSEGVCVDGPFFEYSSSGIREQNHLTRQAGNAILEGILGKSGNPEVPGKGMGRKGVILTGHDHEGCDVYHNILPASPPDQAEWQGVRTEQAKDLMQQEIPGIREITLRSMMGSFGGNAGLLSGWYDYQSEEWHFEYAQCALGVQHIWWAVHVLLLITILMLAMAGLALAGESWAKYKAKHNLENANGARSGTETAKAHQNPVNGKASSLSRQK